MTAAKAAATEHSKVYNLRRIAQFFHKNNFKYLTDFYHFKND
jgi:hypothetical protein